MPGFNQRGPMNEGPMTGRGMGQCTGNYAQDGDTTNMGWNAPGYGQGRGMGRQRCQRPRRGMGMGMGRGAAWMQTPPPQATKATLSARAQQLETELKAIQDELKQMADE